MCPTEKDLLIKQKYGQHNPITGLAKWDVWVATQSTGTHNAVSLPILCILHYKTIDRPYYYYSPLDSTYNNPDGGFYNSWTGGIFVVTDQIKGFNIKSYAVGDQYCKNYYGS